ncbi:hypothetical protein Acor_65210 [Acrocarpospora corrugata]|uniref:CAAX prenyl protease 2/Lysostaphin resistance protein A-like domain-containing protein n=2 Tax=Acrocarpospora corrugata TaxID=35763 RepID=A0A5M3WBB7_9ACTN|nr:type II CAAX endopeptidase family protein [Acrocarpospora corrugata]GES04453.1 hypothetical protein Acor_65210 [Acrocarpospora corrugata]
MSEITTSASPAEGVPYHRLAHGVGWRRMALSLVSLVVASIAVVAVAFISVDQGQRRVVLAEMWFGLALGFVMLAMLLPVALLATRIQGRPAGTLSSVVGRLRWGLLWRCLLAAVGAAVIVSVVRFAAAATGLEAPYDFGDDTNVDVDGSLNWSIALTLLFMAMPIQSAAEEYIFRGWLPQFFGAFLRNPLPGALVSAVAFAYGHAWFIPSEVRGLEFLKLLLTGLVLAYLTIATGGVEAAIAYQATSNIISALVTFLPVPYELTEYFPYGAMIAQAVGLAMFALLVLRLHRRGGYARLASPPPGGRRLLGSPL